MPTAKAPTAKPPQISLAFEDLRVRDDSTRGPKPRAERAGFMEHLARPDHSGKQPAHVTIWRAEDAPDLRSEPTKSVILSELERARKNGLRIVDVGIQADHLHVLIEAKDADDLSDALRRFFSRIAMNVNQATRRSGSLFRDRHRRQELTSAREVKEVRDAYFSAHPSTCTAAPKAKRGRPKRTK